MLTFEAELAQAGRYQKSRDLAAAIRHLETGIALYQGDFLSGFDLPDCLDFTDWVMRRRAKLQEGAMEALDYLADYWMQRGEYERALHYARQQLVLEPWWEEAHRRVMTILALSGQRSAALGQYYQCRQTLHTYLDILPDAETETLYRRIVQESRGLMPTTLSALAGQPLHLPPSLPGWEEEWEKLPPSILRAQLLIGVTRAAERAWREYNHADTIGFLSAALDLVRTEDIERRWELLSTRERVYHFIADRAAQARDLGELEKLAEHLTDASRIIALRVRQMQYACRLGEYAQALAWGKQALQQATEGEAPDLLARVHEALGEVRWNLGDYAIARTHIEKALTHYLAAGDQEGEARARNGLGNIWRRLGGVDAAQREWERALQLYRNLDNEWGMGMTMNNLGALATDRRDYTSALTYHQQAVAIRRRINDRHGEGSSLNNLSMVSYLMGDYEQAHAHITAAVTLAREMGERGWLVSFLETATRVELARKHYEAAYGLCQEGLTLSEASGDHHNTAFYHHSLGEIALGQGHAAQAVAAFDQACTIRRNLNERGNLSASLAGRATAHLALNNMTAARADAREALALMQETGQAGEYPTQEVQQRIERVEGLGSPPEDRRPLSGLLSHA